MRLILILFLIVFAQACSCNKEDPKFTQLEIIELGRKVEPNLEEVVFDLNNTDDPNRIVCSKYGPGCVPNTGKRIKVRKVELIVLEFENEKLAREEAMRINQWYAKNWLFDNVTNEPVLIDFVQKAYGAVPARAD